MSSPHGFQFRNGTPNAYTRYAAYPGEERRVIIKPPGTLLKEYGVLLSTTAAYIEISGLVIDGANLAWAILRLEASARYHSTDTTSGWKHAHNIRILNNEIRNSARSSCIYFVGNNLFSRNYVHNCRAYGIYASQDAGTIENNIFQNNGGYGLTVYGDTKPVNKWIVRNNIISHNKDYYPIYLNSDGTYRDGYDGTKKKSLPGVLIGSGIGNRFYNNLVYNNPNGGVELFSSSTGTLIANNTIYNNGYGIKFSSMATNTRVINNLIWGNRGTQISSSGNNTVLKNNLTTDPKVVNASSGDFRLRSDSPAIDSGFKLIEVLKDFSGVARGNAYDIGAYEF